MKTKYQLAFALAAGVALGGAAIQGLQAQTKPPTYVIVVLRKITDPATFKTGVVDKTMPATLAAAGAHYVVRSQKMTSFDGPTPERYVIIAFDSPEKALAWHNSAGQKEIDAARMKSTDSLSFMVDGM